MRTDFKRVPLYVLSCIVMHNFLKELGHVVDEEEAERFLDPAEPEDPARQEQGAAAVAGEAREYSDQLRRLFLTNAQE